MPAVPVSKRGTNGKNGKNEPPAKKKKEPPKELCGCGVDTYRPPPRGRKLTTAPVEHNVGCNYQRTTCDAYPYLPRCEVCQNSCGFCGGKNRWCPHCYEIRCQHQYKRVVHGWEPPSAVDAGPSTATGVAVSIMSLPAKSGVAPSSASRRSTVKFVGSGTAGSGVPSGGGQSRVKHSSVSFASAV